MKYLIIFLIVVCVVCIGFSIWEIIAGYVYTGILLCLAFGFNIIALSLNYKTLKRLGD